MHLRCRRFWGSGRSTARTASSNTCIEFEKGLRVRVRLPVLFELIHVPQSGIGLVYVFFRVISIDSLRNMCTMPPWEKLWNTLLKRKPFSGFCLQECLTSTGDFDNRLTMSQCFSVFGQARAVWFGALACSWRSKRYQLYSTFQHLAMAL